jgi:VanZ family protein
MDQSAEPAPAWQRWAAVLLLAVYWLALTAGTHWPRINPFFGGEGGWDKVQHLAAFAGLALLAALVLSRWRPLSLADYAWLAAALLALAAADELTQQLVPGRSCELADWLADSAGIALGLGLWAAGAWWAERSPT